MKKIFYFFLLLLMASTGYSQQAKKYYKMGSEKQQLQDYQGAIDFYSKAIKIKPKYAEAYFERGRSKCEIGNFGEAIFDFNKAITINIGYTEAYAYRGIAKIALQDSYCQEIQPQQATQPQPSKNNIIPASQMKCFEITAKDSALYFKTMREGKSCSIIDTSNATFKGYTKAIKSDPKNSTAYFNRGSVKMMKKDYAGAIDDFSKALEINPTDTNAYFLRGNANIALKNYAGAIKDYTKVIEVEPKMASAYFNRGGAKWQLKDTSAMSDWIKAIEINPMFKWSTSLSNNYAEQIAYHQDYSGAIADFNKAIGINPTYAEAYYQRGMAKIKSGQKDSGCLDLNKAGQLGKAAAYLETKKYCQ